MKVLDQPAGFTRFVNPKSYANKTGRSVSMRLVAQDLYSETFNNEIRINVELWTNNVATSSFTLSADQCVDLTVPDKTEVKFTGTQSFQHMQNGEYTASFYILVQIPLEVCLITPSPTPTG